MKKSEAILYTHHFKLFNSYYENEKMCFLKPQQDLPVMFNQHEENTCAPLIIT